MIQLIRKLILAALILTPGLAAASNTVDVKMSTNKGDMILRLNPERAPITVKNFLSYVDKGYYNNLIFHRVIRGFMIQGGGFNADMVKQSTAAPIKNESTNGLGNRRGTISMARTNNPDSATAQFFINLVNNDFLNASAGRPGYAVFGEVIEGLDVLDSIGSVQTGRRGPYGDVPLQAVTILKAERVTENKKETPSDKQASDNS